jgi:hypothetical protein
MPELIHTPLPLALADDAPWTHHDLTKARALIDSPPAPGDVFLWLVPSEFRFASASNVGNWLTLGERRRARQHPNSAIGRRFGVARATLRLVLSHMFHCAPGEVLIEDGPDERIVVSDPRGGGVLSVDVAYSGIWIVIAAASAKIGIGLTVDAAGEEAMWAESARIGMNRAARGVTDTSRWRGLALPMPGEIRGVVALDRPVARVVAFGWDRLPDFGARAEIS